MCGIAGYVNYKSAKEHREELRMMTEVIIHRGPDSVGYYEDDAVGLGFRRLSIIGIENGQQPILNEDSSMVLTFNGEIYNYAGIREELREKGMYLLRTVIPRLFYMALRSTDGRF